MELKDAILSRRSIRSYTDQPVSREDLEAILDTAAAITAELRQSIPDPHERGKAIRERLRELL